VEGVYRMNTSKSFPIDDVISEVRMFLPKLKEASGAVSDLLYACKGTPPWESIRDLIQGMDDLYRTMNTVRGHLSDTDTGRHCLREAIELFLREMPRRFEELNRYMDEESFYESGDCIRYELLPLFSALADSLGDSDEVRRSRFDKNMACVKQRFPRAYAQLQGLEREIDQYEITTSLNGMANMRIMRNKRNSLHLYSRYEPQAQVQRWLTDVHPSLQGKQNAILYGLGFGYHLSTLMEHYSSIDLHVYEPDPQILLAAMEAVDLTPLLERPQLKDLVVGRNKDHRDGLFYRIMKQDKSDMATLSVPVYDRLDPEWKQVFMADAKNAIYNYAASENMHEKFGLEWVRNRLYNMAYTITTPSIRGLKDKLAGIPAVIVGAGPSLEADIEHLRELKEHAFIIAAGTSILSLKHFGIEPHLIVTMDGGEWNYHLFQRVDINNIPLLYVPQVEHRVLEHSSNHLLHVFFNTDVTSVYLADLRAEDPIFRSSHSVTATAIQAAVYCGCGEIIFTGQDLSYPEENVHATGAYNTKEYNQLILDSANLEVENVNGGFNRTTVSMQLTLADIEEFVASYPEIRFINTSRKGAKIKNTVWESMEAVKARHKLLRLDSRFFIDAMDKHLTPYSGDRKAEMIRRVLSMPDQLNAFSEIIKRMKRNLSKLPELSRRKPEKCASVMNEVGKDWGSLAKTDIVNRIFTVFLKKEFSRFDRELPNLTNETHIVRKAGLFVKIIGDLIQAMEEKVPVIEELVNEAARRVLMRAGKAEGDQIHV